MDTAIPPAVIAATRALGDTDIEQLAHLGRVGGHQVLGLAIMPAEAARMAVAGGHLGQLGDRLLQGGAEAIGQPGHRLHC